MTVIGMVVLPDVVFGSVAITCSHNHINVSVIEWTIRDGEE